MRKRNMHRAMVLMMAIVGSLIFAHDGFSALETPLVVDATSVPDNVPYLQSQWYGFTSGAGKGYCAISTPTTGNNDLYLLDTGFNLVGSSKNTGLTADKIWFGQAVSGALHIGSYGVSNPSTTYNIQVITAPFVKTISPVSGGSGTVVTLTGFGFGDTQGSSYVQFGTVQATSYVSWSNIQIVVSMPAGVSSGAIQAVVYVANKASNGMNFTAAGASSDGTMHRYDLGRSGNFPNGPTAFPLSAKWIGLNYFGPQGTPVVANNSVYMETWNNLRAFDASTGVVKWTYNTADNSSGAIPTIANDTIYLYIPPQTLIAINANSGSLKWSKQFTSSTGSLALSISPAVSNGVVYIGANTDNKVYALDANSGSVKWSYDISAEGSGTYFSASPSVANGIVYISSWRKIYALDANTGALKWSYTPDPNWGVGVQELVVNSGILYFVDGGERIIYSLNATTGTLLNSYPTGLSSNIKTSLTIDKGILYFGCDNSIVYALDTATKAFKWSYAIPWTSVGETSSPAVSKGKLYIGDSTGGMYALDGATGAVTWSYQTGIAGGRASAPFVSNGKVYVRIQNTAWAGGLYCFGQ